MNTPKTDEMPPPVVLRMLRLPEVMQRTGLTRSRIYEMEAKGRFPKRVKIAERASAWVEHEVEAFLLERMAARGASNIKGPKT
jgi:prophage regulatory protein